MKGWEVLGGGEACLGDGAVERSFVAFQPRDRACTRAATPNRQVLLSTLCHLLPNICVVVVRIDQHYYFHA